jgi:hypothetical protein
MRARRRSRLVTGLGCAGVLALAGCMGIPTSGTVEPGEVVLEEPGAAIPIPSGPSEDASAEEIVNGFLAAAGAGVYDDYATALEFLTSTAANGWNPRAGITIYDEEPIVRVLEGQEVAALSVGTVATVDDAGRYTESSTDAPVKLDLTLNQDGAGQWRISDLPDGVLMSWTDFESSHRAVGVYFAALDGETLVPEVRWFFESKRVDGAVQALVAGPSEWLRDGVRTGVAAGVRSPAGVTIDDDDVLSVTLTSDIAGTLDPQDRSLLQAQLEATIAATRAVVSDIKVTVNDELSEAVEGPEPVIDPPPGSGPYVLVTGGDGVDALAEIRGGEVQVLADAAPLAGLTASSPAISLDGSIRVVLDAAQRLVLLPLEGAEPQVLHEGASLLPPSIDRHGWVWTGERLSAGTLTAVSASGEDPVEVPVDWLADREVRSIRVSRDGARLAVAYQSPDGPTVIEVAAIVRDADGRPQGLGEARLVVGAALTDVAEISWLDESTLAVLGKGQGVENLTAYTVPLGGRSEARPALPAAQGIAAALEALYLVDADGELLLLRGEASTWTSVADVVVRDPAFPG